MRWPLTSPVRDRSAVELTRAVNSSVTVPLCMMLWAEGISLSSTPVARTSANQSSMAGNTTPPTREARRPFRLGGVRFRLVLVVALACCFVSLQAEVVAFDASGGDRARGSECGVRWLSLLEAAEFAGGVELARIAVPV